MRLLHFNVHVSDFWRRLHQWGGCTHTTWKSMVVSGRFIIHATESVTARVQLRYAKASDSQALGGRHFGPHTFDLSNRQVKVVAVLIYRDNRECSQIYAHRKTETTLNKTQTEQDELPEQGEV